MDADSLEETKVDFWGIVEVMGRRTFAGRITEQTIAGAKFVRVDVPELRHADNSVRQEPFTKFLSAGAIYGITPATEQLARVAAYQTADKPVDLYDLPTRPALPERSTRHDEPQWVDVDPTPREVIEDDDEGPYEFDPTV